MDQTENDSKTITRAAESVSKTKNAAAGGELSLTKTAAAGGNSSLTKKPPLNPVAALALCALLWSFGGLVIKLIKWDALAIAGIRSLLGMITVTIAFRRLPKLFIRCATETDGKFTRPQCCYSFPRQK